MLCLQIYTLLTPHLICFFGCVVGLNDRNWHIKKAVCFHSVLNQFNLKCGNNCFIYFLLVLFLLSKHFPGYCLCLFFISHSSPAELQHFLSLQAWSVTYISWLSVHLTHLVLPAVTEARPETGCLVAYGSTLIVLDYMWSLDMDI